MPEEPMTVATTDATSTTAGGRPTTTSTRLSTNAPTLGRMVLRAGETNAGPALRRGTGDGALEISYPELARQARDVARGLIALGIDAGDRVSILAGTRPEWTIVDMGAFCAGAVVAPIYHTNSPEECAYVLQHADARAVFCEDAAQAAKVSAVHERCPALATVVVLEGTAEGAMTLEELRALGAGVPDEQVDQRVAAVSPDDVATLIYTSGTTGPPKGCELTHDNFLAATHAYQDRLDMFREDVPIVFFMFLPLAHSLARIVEVSVLDVGGTLAFFGGRADRLLDDLREAQPTYFPSVPRVFEKIHTAAHSSVADHRLRAGIFRRAVATGRRVRAAERSGQPVGRVLRWRHALADRVVLSKIRELFGGRLELAASGAAPVAREILEFFDACGVLILEGWGMTETAAAGTINTERDVRFGTVGRPLPGTEVRVAADGELLMRGPTVFRGYHKNPEATAETLVDGWLATGDLAQIDEDGYVSIVGRKKDLIITSSGKNISPANIENELKTSRWISQAMVLGDGRPYLVAVLTLDPDEAPKLAERLGIEADLAAMAHDERVRAVIQEAVDEVNARFARIEQVKKFVLLDRDLSQAAGELTPTLKIKRSVVARELADTIEALYAEER
ncbi:MAG TPA: long-chain fatty acid--CoA ligase [Baekduia sp.]|nr:long-chain fatty acid--CoA ligase [Baekduia sp.]